MLKYATNEPNSENTDGYCTALYFTAEVSKEEITEALLSVNANRKQHWTCRFPTMPDDFDYALVPTPVSEAAGWVRYECYGAC